MRIVAGVATDTGRVRDHNEDSYVVEPPLYAVADGMGGAKAGEVSSVSCAWMTPMSRSSTRGSSIAAGTGTSRIWARPTAPS